MLSVEDCLEALNAIAQQPVRDASGNIYEINNTWDQRFVNDVWTHCENGQAISTSQSEIVIKLIQRYRDHLIEFGIIAPSIDQLLITPHYKRTPYQSSHLPREVRWAGKNKLVFRCKYNSGVIEDIKKLKGGNSFLPHPTPVWVKEHKLWIVDVDSKNWERVMDVIKRHRFHFDDTVANYFLEVSNSLNQLSRAETKDDHIEVTARNDDFLDSWLNGLVNLES